MSIESWEAEFYPVEVDECAPEQAVEHSLLKWRGLLPANMEKHGVYWSHACRIEDDEHSFGIDIHTCALCQRFDCASNGADQVRPQCPLEIVRARPCDMYRTDEKLGEAPWQARRGDPGRMVWWLEQAKRYEEAMKAGERMSVPIDEYGGPKDE